MKTDTGKTIHRNFISGHSFQSEKRHRRETVPHCLRGHLGKYGKWDEILENIMDGKLRIVQNKKKNKNKKKLTRKRTLMMMKKKKKCRKKPEEYTIHRREADYLSHSGPIPRMTQFKSTLKES